MLRSWQPGGELAWWGALGAQRELAVCVVASAFCSMSVGTVDTRVLHSAVVRPVHLWGFILWCFFLEVWMPGRTWGADGE